MPPRRLFHHYFTRLLALLLLGCAAPLFAQADPPGRIGRLNHAEGAVTFSPSGDNEWTDAEPNRPLLRGDKLWTDKGTRAEVQIGSSTVRLDGQAQIQVLALDDQSTQLSLTQGSVHVRVRNLPEGENFEIDTPNLAWRAAYPGDYRIDVDGTRGTTRVTIVSGTGAVYGDKGQSLAMGGGQQITFRTRALTQMAVQESPPQDNFDRWAAERNRREDQSVAARHVPREVVGYQQLDAHGQWTQDTTHGMVWTPQATPANWAPYRHGRWEWLAPWGWTWIDDAPWAFATSHYGRWAIVNNRWAWVPGRMGLRPMYAPALVAFVGSGNLSTLAVGGKQGVAWFPLAPGEAWQPGYRATPFYISTINANMPPQVNGAYAHQRRLEALTAISAEDFHRGRPVKAGWLKVAGNLLTQAQVVAPPPMPDKPARTLTARTVPAPGDIRQVTSNNTAALAAQQQAEVLRQREQSAKVEQSRAAAEQLKLAEQARAAEQARLVQQARLAEQVRAAELAKLSEQSRLAEQARVAEQSRIAEQARLAAQAKAAEQAKLAQLQQQQQQQRAIEQAREQGRQLERAKPADQARATEQAHGTQARAAELARAMQQARAAEQAKAPAQARALEQQQAIRAEAARREAIARRAELGKREQVGKREQARRELAIALAQREQREQAAKREAAIANARAEAQREAQRELQAKRAQQAKRVAAAARKDAEARKLAHAQQVESARRAAERDAQVLREQRVAREDAARRQAEERERAQRDAWQRQQQALSEQWRRDQQAWEQQQQRERDRAQPRRPDLRNTERRPEPEVWQRGIPILNPGRTS